MQRSTGQGASLEEFRDKRPVGQMPSVYPQSLEEHSIRVQGPYGPMSALGCAPSSPAGQQLVLNPPPLLLKVRGSGRGHTEPPQYLGHSG